MSLRDLAIRGALYGVLIVINSVDSSSNALKSICQSCVFCDIVARKIPSFSFWEDEKYLAFLSIFPNTPGTSVVIPKEHYSSNVWALPPQVFQGLMHAASQVNQILCQLPTVGRTGLVVEGFGVDHAHVKLFPLYGTEGKEWRSIRSRISKQFEVYEGYISSHDGPRADNQELENMQKRLCEFAVKTSENFKNLEV